jgi:hypothetical protein
MACVSPGFEALNRLEAPALHFKNPKPSWLLLWILILCGRQLQNCLPRINKKILNIEFDSYSNGYDAGMEVFLKRIS